MMKVVEEVAVRSNLSEVFKRAVKILAEEDSRYAGVFDDHTVLEWTDDTIVVEGSMEAKRTPTPVLRGCMQTAARYLKMYSEMVEDPTWPLIDLRVRKDVLDHDESSEVVAIRIQVKSDVEVLRLLYPDGISPNQYGVALALLEAWEAMKEKAASGG